jgi:hypothetical protein
LVERFIVASCRTTVRVRLFKANVGVRIGVPWASHACGQGYPTLQLRPAKRL